MIPPPIALFTYNRPDKTDQVLQTLKAQGAARVYIFCDGPKDNDADHERVQKNLDIVHRFPLDEKIILQNETNKGLSKSLVAGISHALSREKSLIILEDDCLPFGGFIKFMAENLVHWEAHEDIFSISAYHFMRPLKSVGIPFDVFSSCRFLPWGWACWRDRWEKVKSELESKKNPYGSFKKVPNDAGRDMRYHSYAVEHGMVDSWAIPLGLITLHKGYRHIMPRHPLVNNTGMDDSGTNTGSSHNRIIPVTKPPQYDFPLKMCPQDYKNPCLDKQFLDSLDVMLPPPWLEKKIHDEWEGRAEAMAKGK